MTHFDRLASTPSAGRDDLSSNGRALSPQAIERFLNGEGLHYYRSPDGVFLVLFDAEDVGEAGVRFELSTEGPDATILTIRVRSDRAYPLGATPSLEARCSRWNREHRWPKAFVVEHDAVGEVVGEYDLPTRDVAVGVDLVDRVCRSVLASGIELWEWMEQQDAIDTDASRMVLGTRSVEPDEFVLTDDDLRRLLEPPDDD